ncbi:MAG: DUF4159 domain-containing protein [Myxococcales bacterium]|nr:MAG: DUF4159 domain-containing protein [Myxococcales bacterium]
MLSRRQFLGALGSAAALTLWPRWAWSFGQASLFELPTLVYDGPWDRRQGAQARLAWELMKRTSVEAKLEHGQVKLDAPELFATPVLYMSGDAAFPEWPEANARRLRRFLESGGFLFIDGNLESSAGFDDSVRRELERMFPDRKLATLDAGHTLFQSFYLLDGRWGRVQRKTYVEGISDDTRAFVVYSQNDVGGAWLRDNFGNWRFPAVPGGEAQREMAFRFGVNVVMYALCTTYKSDQVHIPFILKRRRR